MEPIEKPLTVREVAEYFQVTARTVHNWIKRGELQVLRIGRCVRIPQSALLAKQQGGAQ